MRYHLIDSDNNEILITLRRATRQSTEMLKFVFTGEQIEDSPLYLRKLAGKYYVSHNGIHWEKIAKQSLPKKILHINKHFDLYRGYKPSGLSQAEAGELTSQMPGKVIKVAVKKGQKVQEGQTLLIIEAMKMENEIKSNFAGVIKSVHVKEGQTLDAGILMMELEQS